MLTRRLLRANTFLTSSISRYLPQKAYRPFANLTMPASEPPSLEHVTLETEEGIAILRYNRPKNGNALHTPMLKDILAGLQWADQHENVRAIITTGSGKLYTAGLDLLDPVNQGLQSTISHDFIDALSEIHKTMINSNKVLIAAVNGPAPGWGTSSLALHDLVYATPDAYFFTPFVQWGLCAEACSSYTFKNIMGRQKASALILAGSRMTAQELDQAGLVTKILEKEKFLEGVLDVARGMVKLPPKTLRLNKELMMRGTREELLRVNDLELTTLKEQAAGSESKDAIAGFKELQAKKKKEKDAKAKL